MTGSDELATREARAQHGIVEFAEEMAAIRDGKLYPNAGKTDAWKTYCKERWGMSKSSVDRIVLARPVLQRHDSHVGRGRVAVTAAAAVATLPEKVQDVILVGTPKRDDVTAKAKAARKVQKQAEREGRDADADEMIAAAKATRAPRKVAKAKPEPMPEEFKDENLPPRLRPEDHGWAPRKLAGESLLALWRVGEKLKDEVPPTDEDRDATIEKVSKTMELATVILSYLRGENPDGVTDADLYALMERES